MDGVTLRIFSGVHLGAEIELTEGTYVLGTDDSCDIILNDSSLVARHAALRVSLDGPSAQVTAEPLDGTLLLSGDDIRTEQTIPPRQPFRLGLVLLAWTETPSAGAAAWQEVEERIARENRPRDAEVPEQKATSSASSDADANNDGIGSEAQEAELSLDKQPEETGHDVPGAGPSRRPFRILGLFLVFLLIGALCLTWRTPDDGVTAEEQVRTLLDEAGYQKLTVTGTDSGVTVSGRIASDRERGRLLRLAQFLQFPVYLDVTVGSDAADAVRASFNSLGLFPEVTELPPSSHPGLLVKGYIKNGVLEEQALTETMRNVPYLRPSEQTGKPKLTLFRDIRYEADVQMQLSAALAEKGLGAVKTDYLPGKVVLHGAFTPQTKAALEEATTLVRDRLGVPVPFDIINDAEILTPAKNDNIYTRQETPRTEQPAKASAPKSEEPAGFRVTSVSMGAMKFITLDNGERVFEGGELPGGYVLEQISVDTLTLSKNNQTTLYPLRGLHE